jgi:NAD+ kinase
MSSRITVPSRIVLLPNTEMPKALQLAESVGQHLAAAGASVNTIIAEPSPAPSAPDLTGADLVIVLGGDGTLLRAGHLCAPLGIPLLGVQAGKLGFLSELTESSWEDALPRLLSGSFRIEQRMMLLTQLIKEERVCGEWDVINEIVVSRGRIVRPIEVRVDLNEGYLTSYIADGLIIATATGSTAYALAVGGPILPPELRNMLLLPIAPHLSLDRAVVLAEGASVVLRAHCDHEAVISVDGIDPIRLNDTDAVRVTANQHSLKMVRFGEPNYFYHRLATVLHDNPALKQNHHD